MRHARCSTGATIAAILAREQVAATKSPKESSAAEKASSTASSRLQSSIRTHQTVSGFRALRRTLETSDFAI